MREVTFGMIWQCYGRQTVEIPDDIVVNDEDDIRGYLESIWKSIPLPDGDYVEDSDTIDEVVGFKVRGEVDEPQCYIDDGEGFPAAVNRNVKVEWTDIGEGLCGDYNAEDPEDVSLLRFDVSVLRNGHWEEVSDASYCTLMPTNTDVKILEQAAEYLAKEYANVLGDNPEASVKKMGESLSWICPEWFRKGAADVGKNGRNTKDR